MLTPFSSSLVSKEELKTDQNKLWKTFSVIVRILYFPFGLVLAIFNIAQIAGLFISIIGIPNALVLAKSLGTYFNPVNKICVPKAVETELDRRKAEQQVKKYLDN